LRPAQLELAACLIECLLAIGRVTGARAARMSGDKK
jgi:hypothetical protein